MTEWIDTLAPHVLVALHLHPIDQITAKFSEKFRRQDAAQDGDQDDIMVFERFVSLVSSNNGIKPLLPFQFRTVELTYR